MSQFNQLVWEDASRGSVPYGAVVGGKDGYEPLYVARARHNGDWIPGKLHPSHGTCYVPWGGKEHAKPSYQVLVNRRGCGIIWERAKSGSFPNGSIQGGTASGEGLIIARASHNGATIPGKLQPSHGSLYVPYGGKEVAIREYEVLVVRCLVFD